RAQAAQSLRGRLGALLNPAVHPFRAVECGVYMGSSLLACALMARDMAMPYRMIGMDTFSGLPPLSAKDQSFAPMGARYLSTQVFADTSKESVQAEIVRAGLGRHIELRQGLFSEILPTLPEQRYHFVNIDCDLYEPHIECLEYFYPRMESGGIIFFDDYHSVEFPMAGQAIDCFMRDKPEQLLHLRFGEDGSNRTKCYLVKY
ncbi:MAG: class I SAM-dependent methyltransferase, partial [Nitrospira sp.]|nr:class I SAM-dependent methyltransferase [Nitrospira sp.]